MPFENSSNGSVVNTLDCFVDRDGDFKHVSVWGEVYMDVQHCLVGHTSSKQSIDLRNKLSPTSSGQATPTKTEPAPKQPRTQPLVDLKDITDIYSHPQAFGQCQRFLSTYLKQADHHEVTSTSKAAQIVKEEGFHTAAAISSELAADVYGLSLLAKDIQDREDNTTRFLLLHNGAASLARSPENAESGEHEWKSLLVFSVDHESRGALAQALLVFAQQELNLTHFNSRPSRLRPWHYFFIVECQSFGTGSTVARQIEAAIDHLTNVTEVRKCLGYWREYVRKQGSEILA